MKWWPTLALIVFTACSSHKPPQPDLPSNPPGITRVKSAKVLAPPSPRRYQLIWEYDQPGTIFSIFISSDFKTWDLLGDTLEHAYPIDSGQDKAFFLVGVQ